MKKVISSAILVLMMTSAVFAQTGSDAAELTRLLHDFLAGASRNDASVHERFWANDLIYTRSAGRRVNKADVMRDVRSAPAPKPTDPKTVYTAEDIRIQQYGDTAVVAFRLVSTTEVGGTKQIANNLNSGTFVKREGKWQVVNWQSTRMPRTEDEPCILNQVTAQALAVAMPFLAQARPDLNAARMAFRACYDRLAEVEKLARRAPQHFLSPAGTIEAQQDAIAEGVRQGLLPTSAAPPQNLLGGPTASGRAQLKQIGLMIAARPMPKPEDKDYD